MYAQHFKINVSLSKEDNMFEAQILCRYCKKNLFEGSKTYTTEEDLWNKIHEVYQNDNGINFDLHLMMCAKYGESLK